MMMTFKEECRECAKLQNSALIPEWIVSNGCFFYHSKKKDGHGPLPGVIKWLAANELAIKCGGARYWCA